MLFLDNKTFKKEIITLILDTILYPIIVFPIFFIIFLGVFDDGEYYIGNIRFTLVLFYPLLRLYFILFFRKIFGITNNIEEAYSQKYIIITKLLICDFILFLSIYFCWNKTIDSLQIFLLMIDVISVYISFIITSIINMLKQKGIISHKFSFCLIDIMLTILVVSIICIFSVFRTLETNYEFITLLLISFFVFLIQSFMYYFIIKYFNINIKIPFKNFIHSQSLKASLCTVIFAISTIIVKKDLINIETTHIYTIAEIISIILVLIISSKYIYIEKSD